ncbi:hypothetical protein Hanom_Chr06g00503721 [Helianthus anomalus]
MRELFVYVERSGIHCFTRVRVRETSRTIDPQFKLLIEKLLLLILKLRPEGENSFRPTIGET